MCTRFKEKEPYRYSVIRNAQRKNRFFLRGYCADFLQRKPFRYFTTEHIVAQAWAAGWRI